MSKAFTKEEDDAGFSPPSASALALPPGRLRITTAGAKAAGAHPDPRVREAVARAEVLARVVDPERAALGVTVRVRADGTGAERAYRLVSAEERALLGEGCSVEGPIGRALLGARVGDLCEVALPRGLEELEILALEGEPE